MRLFPLRLPRRQTRLIIIILIFYTLASEDPIVGATLAVARNNKAGASPAPTIGAVIGSFESLCFRRYKKNVEINIYSVMPNHIHLIVSILASEDPIVGATLAVARNNRAGASPAPTIGAVIGSFESLCFRRYKKNVEINIYSVMPNHIH